ncbi:hypothetical protein [Streptomyces qinglanensis]|uniref:Membrane protein involved in the export of O-antigen and teichoic acid n=1 Tax=Streptomyces qinglanensis TaxID=943816 RepID=A0A1H9NQM9_9ACTN|nr:hypothetical protein [Streptomyces qinglanensis]SER38290.1 Membrane protein involved in the export of O-antigen and teichoic acid [Streptomyces qinglanensis]
MQHPGGGPAREPERRRPRARTALVCSVADQGVAAATNIAVLVVAARRSDVHAFATFSLVYTVFTVLLGLTVAYVGQALVLEQGAPERVARACRSGVAFTALAAAAPAVIAAPALWAVGGGTGTALAALALVLPLALTQETTRYAFATLHRPQYALLADVLRLAAVLPALAAQPSGAGAARLLLAWGVSALPALAVALWLLGRHTRGAGQDPARCLRRDHLGRRFAVEFGVGNAGSQLAVIGLGLLADPLAVGALRGAGTLYGPMNVLFNAATGFGPPLLNRTGGGRRAARAAAAAGGVLAALAAAWTTVLLLLPDGYGRALLGDTWASAARLLPATGSQYAAMALGTCGLLTLRVLRPRTTLPLQLVFSLASVCCLLGGYLLGGVLGAAWGLCLGSAAKGAASWLRAARLLRTAAAPDGVSAPDPALPAPGPGRAPGAARPDAEPDAGPAGAGGPAGPVGPAGPAGPAGMR